MNRRPLVVVASLLVLAGGLWWLTRTPDATLVTDVEPAAAAAAPDRPPPPERPTRPGPARPDAVRPDTPRPATTPWPRRPPAAAKAGRAGGELPPSDEPEPAARELEPDPDLDPDRDLDPDAMVWALDRDGILGAVASAQPKIAECYDGWVQADRDLGGRLVVAFHIAADPDDPELGAIDRADVVETELEHALLEGCVLNAVSELVFEPPDDEDGLQVRMPFLFSKDDEDEEVGDPP